MLLLLSLSVLYKVIALENGEVLTGMIKLYVNLSASSPVGNGVYHWMELSWVLSVSTSPCLLWNLSVEWRMPLLMSEQSVFTCSEGCLIVRRLFLEQKKEIGWRLWSVSYMPAKQTRVPLNRTYTVASDLYCVTVHKYVMVNAARNDTWVTQFHTT